ncbi:hypothetical protein KCU73_g8530, partial [Aureobasidium melanogenum]
MAEPPTVIDPGTDDQPSHQAPNNNLRKLIAIDQDFAKDLALEAVREIEMLWPDLIAERFASQDIIDLSNALRTGKVLLEPRMLRSFLVLWKDKIGNRRSMSSQQLIDLAASIHGLVSRQLGPAGKQSSADAMIAADTLHASRVDDVPYRSYTGGYYLDHFEEKWPPTLFKIFNWEEGYAYSKNYQEGIKECQSLWPDLEERYIPTVQQLKLMAREIREARLGLEFRLLRPFMVCWMQNPPHDPENFVVGGHLAKCVRGVALAQAGPKNMVTHDDGSITILRREDEEYYNPEEDSDLEEEEKEQAKRDRLATEGRYPRNRPAPGKKRKRSSSTW